LAESGGDSAIVPSPRQDGPRRAEPPAVVLGMPHLCMGGLSETWLLKELGHRHWSMLAGGSGRSVPDFRDAAGEPVYPAFTSIAIRDAAFNTLHQHDELAFSSQGFRISRSQFTTVHRLSVKGRSVGMLELTSIFVKRLEKGRNRSVVRLTIDGLPPFSPSAGLGTFAATAADIRSDRWHEHFGFSKEDRRESGRLVIDPCPSQDFNGVDFLYFAAYQAFIDRAEWAFFRPLGPRWSTVRRDLVYRGNIEPGERIVVTLLGARRDKATLSHWCRIEREEDGPPLADVFTLRTGLQP
jgi:probable biosynthetic protein (TIGR04099 family)